jgi:hypothetical protein
MENKLHGRLLYYLIVLSLIFTSCFWKTNSNVTNHNNLLDSLSIKGFTIGGIVKDSNQYERIQSLHDIDNQMAYRISGDLEVCCDGSGKIWLISLRLRQRKEFENWYGKLCEAFASSPGYESRKSNYEYYSWKSNSPKIECQLDMNCEIDPSCFYSLKLYDIKTFDRWLGKE